MNGANEGKDVYTLMREIRRPPALDVGESYGKVTWSIRGIYEGYAGWFDGNPSMYGSARDVYADVVQLAGRPMTIQNTSPYLWKFGTKPASWSR